MIGLCVVLIPIQKVKLKTFQSFHELNLPMPLALALKDMAFHSPTPVQAAAVPVALEGKDVLATAQTGTGKTGAFGVPLLASLASGKRRQALILAPTRELAAQIHSVLKQMGKRMDYRGALVVGGESFNRQADALYDGVDYIIATPGRLNDHLQEKTVSLRDIDLLVLDEVDRMLDMGFAPQIKAIMRHVPKDRQTMLFSATLPQEIANMASAFLTDPVRIAIGTVSEKAAQVKEETIRTSNEGKITHVIRELDNRPGKILIFARTKSRTDRLASTLHKEGFSVVAMHGDRSQAQRKQALEAFRTGRRRIMVATDLAGRGIDVQDIEVVINYDLPGTREDYVHRIGRTARCGKEGIAINLLVNGDIDGEQMLTGEKKKSTRVVYRSPRRRR